MKTNLIGISGKIGAGKDATASIIQELTAVKTSYGTTPVWHVKKFAGKLKEIVALLIGCSVQDLENQDFKNKALSEYWRVWTWENIEHPGERVSPVYASREDSDYCVVADDGNRYVRKSEILTPRRLLQIVGTECGRQIIHPNIWVNSLFQDDDNANWIITDVRFPNEANAIKERGGVLIRVNRGLATGVEHESETALDDYEGFDYIIENTGTIEDLKYQVEDVMQDIKLI